MAPAHDTVVFVPAWNEEANLPGVLAELAAALPAADVLVIDDGSTDATAKVARGGGATVVSFGENRGLRAGIAVGYREAAERGYAFCGRVDADGQHPAEELARLLELVRSDACDVAIGSRFAGGDGYDAGRYVPSPSRRFGIGLLQKAMHIRLGRPFHDPTSGMAAVNAQAMPVMAERYVSEAPEVEALLRLQSEGLRVEEVAVHMRERASGESKLQGKKAVKLVLTVIGTLLFFRWLRRRGS
jgi:glycosyltransferase involved in cell wall biosynthesis